MANVTGQIGQESVVLENAATEATLKLLLQAALATTKAQKDAVKDLATKVIGDPAKVEEFNQEVSKSGGVIRTTAGAFGGLTAAGQQLQVGFNKTVDVVSKLVSGTNQASDVFGAMKNLPLGIGLVASGFEILAKYQEQQLKAYQSMSSAGVNFGGSLNAMKLASLEYGMTMEQFSNVMKENGKAFALMGPTVEAGKNQFLKMNKELINGDIGLQLKNLGLTAEDISNGFAGFIQMQGGLGATQIKDQKALEESFHNYTNELDMMTRLTGETRKEQQDAQAQLKNDAVFQNELSKLVASGKINEANQLKFLGEQAKIKGAGAFDNLIGTLTNTQPVTAAGRAWAGVQSEQTRLQGESVKLALEGKLNSQQAVKSQLEQQAAMAKTTTAFGASASVNARMNNEYTEAMTAGLKAESNVRLKGLNTQEGINAAMVAAQKEQEDIAKKATEVKAANERQEEMAKLSQHIMETLIPIINQALPQMNKFIQGFSDAVSWMSKNANTLKLIGESLLAAYVTAKAVQGAKAAYGVGSKVAEFIGGGKGAAGVAEGAISKGPLAAVEGAAGGGGGIAGFIRSMGMALAALGPEAPLIAAGAAAVGAAITLIGAGIAGATWLMGKALPSLASGLKAFGDIDGVNLIKVGAGIAALGLGLGAFGAGSALAGAGGVIEGLTSGLGKLFGAKSPIDKIKEYAALGPSLEKSGIGIMKFNTGLAQLLATDTGKIYKVAAAMAQLKNSIPQESFSDRAANLLTGLVTKAIEPAAATATATTAATGAAGTIDENNLVAQVQRLNSISVEMLKHIKDTADQAKKNVEATKALNRNVWA